MPSPQRFMSAFDIYTGSEEVQCDQCGVKGVEMLTINGIYICGNAACLYVCDTDLNKEQIQFLIMDALWFLREEIDEACSVVNDPEQMHENSRRFWKDAEQLIHRGEQVIDKKKVAAFLKEILEVYGEFVERHGLQFIWKSECEKTLFGLEGECCLKPAKR